MKEPVVLEAGARDYADPTTSAYVVFGANLALPLFGIAVLFVSALRLRRKAKLARESQARAKEKSASPGAGEAVIHGKVSSVEGEGPAVRLTITQYGHQVKSDKRWKTKWIESERRVETQPFVVTTDAGNVIQVQPDDHVQLVDDLETRPVRDRVYRDKVAELTIGEEVYAFGLLAPTEDRSAGYRGAATGWALRPAGQSAPMQFSTKPLSEPYSNAAATRVLLMILVLVVTLVVQGIAATYHVGRAYGADELATVVSHEQKHTEEDHYHHVLVRLETGEEEQIPVSSHTDFDRLAPGAVTHVHVSRAVWTRITLDRGARVHKTAAYIPSVVVVLVLILCGVALRRDRPWYERKSLNDTEPGKIEPGKIEPGKIKTE